jgi:hypothetical protein
MHKCNKKGIVVTLIRSRARPMPAKKLAALTVFLISFLLLYSTMSFADVGPLKPEMIIRFTKGTLACLTRDDLHEILEYGTLGEATKMRAMMVDNGGTCLMISPTTRVKIISVEYNNPDDPDLGLIEFVGEKKTSINGAWALSM